MRRQILVSTLALLSLMTAPLAADDKSGSSARLSDTQRRDLIRALMAEPVYIHRIFPMGKTGIRIEDGKVTPNEAEVRMMAAQSGTAAKPGDRAKITDVHFLSKGIVFEINGGPVKKKKWYERLEVGGGGGSTTSSGQGPVDETKLYSNAQGSFVLLQFKDHIPALTPDEVKSLLEPAFDFKAGSVAEAYEHAMPPKIADAIKNHRVLVGMDRDMVTYAKGRPPRRYRDRDGDNEYEEWIYGQPPEPVEFIRFVGDRVARIETMQVDGQKIVRNTNEVGDLNDAMSAMAKKNDKPAEEDTATRSAPSLLRPGETAAKVQPTKPADNNQAQKQLPPSSAPPSIPGADQGSPSSGPGMGGPPMPGGPPRY
jgi:hypothetical protein